MSNRYTVTTGNDFRAKVGRDVSHFNVSFIIIVQGKSHETVSINHF